MIFAIRLVALQGQTMTFVIGRVVLQGSQFVWEIHFRSQNAKIKL